MGARFFLLAPDGKTIPVETALYVGRDPSCQHVVSTDPAVSRFHVTIWEDPSGLHVRDENASNGTFVNDVRLAPAETTILRPGDRLRLATTNFEIREAAAPRLAEAPASAAERRSSAGVCPQCGAAIGAGFRFCANCGTAVGAENAASPPVAAPAPVVANPLPPASPSPPSLPPLPLPSAAAAPLVTSAPPDSRVEAPVPLVPAVAAPGAPGLPPARAAAPVSRGLSMAWLIVPTLVYAYLSRSVVNTLFLGLVATGLRWSQTREEIPAALRLWLPLLQPVIIFFFLGGNPIVISGVGAVAFVAALQHRPLIRLLEPWWSIQQRVPSLVRRLIALAIGLVVGYVFGERASGREWTFTLLSIGTATIIAFLLTFNPPAALRTARAAVPAPGAA